MEQSSQDYKAPRIEPRPKSADYDNERATPHFCDGTLGRPPHRKHEITEMYHAGDEWSGRKVRPRFRCPVCGFTGFSSVKPRSAKPLR